MVERQDPLADRLVINNVRPAVGLYLAELCRVQVTGITLSEQQQALAQARACEKALSNQIDFRLQDYNERGDRAEFETYRLLHC